MIINVSVDISEVSPQSLNWLEGILAYRGEGEEITAAISDIVRVVREEKAHAKNDVPR